MSKERELTEQEMTKEIIVLTKKLGNLIIEETPKNIDILDSYSITVSAFINVLSKFIVSNCITAERHNKGEVTVEEMSKDLKALAQEAIGKAVEFDVLNYREMAKAGELPTELEELDKKDDIKWN